MYLNQLILNNKTLKSLISTTFQVFILTLRAVNLFYGSDPIFLFYVIQLVRLPPYLNEGFLWLVTLVLKTLVIVIYVFEIDFT